MTSSSGNESIFGIDKKNLGVAEDSAKELTDVKETGPENLGR
jgi:hypothetical protein